MMKKILERIFGSRSAERNQDCSEFEVDNWAVSEFILRKLIYRVGVRPFPLNELSLLAATVVRFKPTHIFEWGTHIGKSARIFYETAEYFKIDTEIHSIDLPDDVSHTEHPGLKRGQLVRGLKNVFLHQGDGLGKSLEIIKQAPPASRILFYVDGDHSYESVKRELSGIIKNVPGAWILLHDTFYQSKEANYNIGPFLAVRDALEETGGNFKMIEEKIGLPGMILLYK